MAKFLTVEEKEKKTPVLLFVDTNSGLKNTLLDFLIETLEKKTKVYVLLPDFPGTLHLHIS